MATLSFPMNPAAGAQAGSAGPPGSLQVPPSSTIPAALPSLKDTYGAVLLGTFFSLILYGVALHQAYRYTRNHFKDSVIIKCFVAFIMIFDTYHTVLSMHISYWYLVVDYFRPDKLASVVWSIKLLPVSTAVGIIICQGFFAYRVYLVGRHFRPLVAVACVLFMAELGLALAGTIQAFLFTDFVSFRKLSWLNSAGFSVIVAADLLLTSILIWVLHRSRTGFQRTDSMINLLIAYTVCTGLVADVISIINLVMALASPDNWTYAGTDLVSNKIYVNSVLAALNYRRAFSAQAPGDYNSYVKRIALSMTSQPDNIVAGTRKSDLLESHAAERTAANLPPALDPDGMA